jgi:hypothetical protein
MHRVAFTIAATSALIGLGVVKLIMKYTAPVAAGKCPQNPRKPPAGWRIYQGEVTPELTAFAVSALAQPLGTWVQGPGGVCALTEWHYHTPGGALKPWGCHKGATLYEMEP